MTDDAYTHSGSCVCGAIRYRARELRAVWYCHCRQCRKMTGHYMAAAQVDLENIEIEGEPKWYYLNEVSRHGFCPECGAQLFWRNDGNDYLSVTAGGLDDASDLQINGHIYCDEKGGYYTIPDEGRVLPRGW